MHHVLSVDKSVRVILQDNVLRYLSYIHVSAFTPMKGQAFPAETQYKSVLNRHPREGEKVAVAGGR